MKSFRGSTLILLAILVIVMLGFGIVIPLMPFLVTHFKAGGTAMGLQMAIYSLMQFLFAPLWGRLSDRVGRKPVLIIGIAGFALAFVLQGIARDIIQLILYRSLAGILSAATLPTATAYIGDTTTEKERSSGMGLMGAAMGLGMIFGPMLGGMLTRINPQVTGWAGSLMQVMTDPATGEPINLSMPFFGSALLALITLPFVIFLLPESLPPQARAELANAHPKSSSFSLMWKSLGGTLSFLYILSFLFAFALANMESVLGLFIQDYFHMGPDSFGLFMGGMGLLSVIQQGALVGPLTRKYGEVRVIQGGLLVSVIGLAGLPLLRSMWGMIACALVFMTGNALLRPCVTALISKRTTIGQGLAMGLANSYQSLGRTMGPLLGGITYEVNPAAPFLTGALVLLVSFIFAMRPRVWPCED